MMKKCLARHAWWLLTISMMSAILFIQCVCNNPSREKFSKPTGSSNPPNPPGPHGGAMVKRARQKGASDFLIKKLQEVENKAVGTDINERQAGTQNTALHEAVSLGDIELIRYLLVNHADFNAKNSNNETASDIAAKQDFAQSFLDELRKEAEVTEEVKKKRKELEEMIERMNTSTEQSKRKIKKMVDDWKEQLKVLEEKEKERRKEVKKIVAEQERQASEWAQKQQELTKAQEVQKHNLQLKNGKIFIYRKRAFNFKEITKLLGVIRGDIDYFNDEKKLLDEACKEDISSAFIRINKELKGIQEEIDGIEKCLNAPEKSSYLNNDEKEKDKKDLELAKGLIKDLERCQEELYNLLAPRKLELLSDPQLKKLVEAAYKEVEQRKASK
jgi:hypothetical protein